MIAVTDDLDAALAIRHKVFVEEQGISFEDDVDGKDAEAVHLLATENCQAVGTARLLLVGLTGKIGRVAVLPERRGAGHGKALVIFAIEELARRGARQATLGAQSDAVGFYEALGFSVRGPEFMDAGLPHREMVRDL